MQYQLIESPGHSWLRVSVSEIDRIGILDIITDFSYIHGGSQVVFLEEDIDMTLFLKRKQEIGEPVDISSCDYRWVWNFPDHPDFIQGKFYK